MAGKKGKSTRAKNASTAKGAAGAAAEPAAGGTNVLISVDDEHLSDLDSVLQECRTAGLENVQALRSIGTITGTIAGNRKAVLSRIPGVRSVETEVGYHLPPSESEVQ